MRVQLADAVMQQDHDTVAKLQQKTGSVTSQDRDQFYITWKSDWQNKNLYAWDDSSNSSACYNPIDQITISPLTFPTSSDEKKGVYLTSFYYTIRIPEED
jgi:hypothetical protein